VRNAATGQACGVPRGRIRSVDFAALNTPFSAEALWRLTPAASCPECWLFFEPFPCA
jgi:hypothetical protein